MLPGARGCRGAAGLPGRRQPDGDRRVHLRPGRRPLPRRRLVSLRAWSAARGRPPLRALRGGRSAVVTRLPSPASSRSTRSLRPAANARRDLPRTEGAALPRRRPAAPAARRNRNLRTARRPAPRATLHQLRRLSGHRQPLPLVGDRSAAALSARRLDQRAGQPTAAAHRRRAASHAAALRAPQRRAGGIWLRGDTAAGPAARPLRAERLPTRSTQAANSSSMLPQGQRPEPTSGGLR